MTTEPLVWPAKDPGDVLDYEADITGELGSSGDALAGVTFTVTDGTVVKGSTSFSGAVATVWLSGGVADERSTVHMVATTAQGRTIDRDIYIDVRQL